MPDPAWRFRHQDIGQLLGDVRREEAGVRVRDLVDLGVHRGEDVRVTVAKAGDRSTAGRVDVLLAVLVGDEQALRGYGDGYVGAQGAMDDVGHFFTRSGSSGTSSARRMRATML